LTHQTVDKQFLTWPVKSPFLVGHHPIIIGVTLVEITLFGDCAIASGPNMVSGHRGLILSDAVIDRTWLPNHKAYKKIIEQYLLVLESCHFVCARQIVPKSIWLIGLLS